MRIDIEVGVLFSLLILRGCQGQIALEDFVGDSAPLTVEGLHLAPVHRVAGEGSDTVLRLFDLVLAEPDRDHCALFVLGCALLKEPIHQCFLLLLVFN